MVLDFSRKCKLPGNTSFFNIIFDLLSIIAKKVNQIRKIVACVVAHLAFLFYCALTTGCCNVFQQIFVNQKNRSFRTIFPEYDVTQNMINIRISYICKSLSHNSSPTQQYAKFSNFLFISKRPPKFYFIFPEDY